MKEGWVYRRGDIYYANLNPYKGSEQGGTRPVLVLQNNAGNFFCSTIIVVPLTTSIYKKVDLPTHVQIKGINGLNESLAMMEQIRAIDKKRVISYIGRLQKDQIKKVEETLLLSLGIIIPEEIEAP